MHKVKADSALWSGSMAPEGVLLAWRAADGAQVDRGAPVADLMIEGCRHELLAPAAGRLVHDVDALYVFEPDDVLGSVI